MEYSELARVEYEEIKGILPKKIVKGILSKVEKNEDAIGEYRNTTIIYNRPDWLCHLFVKILMPFQMKTNRKGERKQSMAGTVYSVVLMIIILFFIFCGILKYLLIPIWIYVFIRALLPVSTAFVRLNKNKVYYKAFFEEEQ